MNQNNEKSNAEKSAQTNQTINNPKGDMKDKKADDKAKANDDKKGHASTLPAGQPKK